MAHNNLEEVQRVFLLEGKLELVTDVVCSRHSGNNNRFPEEATKKDILPLSPEKPKMKKRIKRDRYLDNII